MANEISIALAGQPNCGKSTIFNLLTGAKQHVANYPGVTIEKKYGYFKCFGSSMTLIDLPGTYSLASYSPEEITTRTFLLEEKPELILGVLDASSVEKGLYFLLQLLEMEQKVVVALNMVDVAQSRQIYVDEKILSKELGVSVVSLSAAQGKGKDELLKAIDAEKTQFSKTQSLKAQFSVYYGDLEPFIERVMKVCEGYDLAYPLRWTAIKLLEKDSHVESLVKKSLQNSDVLKQVEDIRNEFREKFKQDPCKFIGFCRHEKAREIAQKACRRPMTEVHSLTEKLDAVLCHKIFGPLCLALILYLFYYLSVTVGNILAAKGWVLWTEVENFARAVLPQENFLYDELLTSLGNWIVKSVTSVLNYLPIFLIMFALVAILEDSGYLARIAFILDRIFHAYGLHGQSTLPLILGGVYVGGCAIPGVMATKGIPDERSRFVTILIVPMMNCLAKVPLYLLLIAVFFPDTAGSAMFFIGTVTLFMGMITAKILSLTVLKHKCTAPFIIELPNYHIPMVKSVLLQTFQRIWLFFKKISTIIVAVSVIVFALISYPGLSDDRKAYYDAQAQAVIGRFMADVEKTALSGKFTEQDIMPLIGYQDELRAKKKGVSQEEAKLINAQALKDEPVLASIVLRQGKDGKILANSLRTLDSSRKDLRREMRQEIFEKSLIGRAGKALESVTKWAGFDWKINVALLSALAAKENSAATLGAIYGIESGTVADGLKAQENGITPLHALALMLFMTLYPPCIPAAMMIKLQTGSAKWMIFSMIYQMTAGLLVASFVFTGANLLGLSAAEAMWTYYGLCLITVVLLYFVKLKEA